MEWCGGCLGGSTAARQGSCQHASVCHVQAVLELARHGDRFRPPLTTRTRTRARTHTHTTLPPLPRPPFRVGFGAAHRDGVQACRRTGRGGGGSRPSTRGEARCACAWRDRSGRHELPAALLQYFFSTPFLSPSIGSCQCPAALGPSPPSSTERCKHSPLLCPVRSPVSWSYALMRCTNDERGGECKGTDRTGY